MIESRHDIPATDPPVLESSVITLIVPRTLLQRWCLSKIMLIFYRLCPIPIKHTIENFTLPILSDSGKLGKDSSDRLL